MKRGGVNLEHGSGFQLSKHWLQYKRRNGLIKTPLCKWKVLNGTLHLAGKSESVMEICSMAIMSKQTYFQQLEHRCKPVCTLIIDSRSRIREITFSVT